MIVSHDSGFLDNVCTDIIHYETRKLVHYKVRRHRPRPHIHASIHVFSTFFVRAAACPFDLAPSKPVTLP